MGVVQLSVLQGGHTLGRGQDQYCWTMWPVLLLLRPCSSAGIMDGEYTTVHILRMQESFVEVLMYRYLMI